ncbi:MAG: ribbon-helix-helix domain-containing protein [Leptospirillum sp.]
MKTTGTAVPIAVKIDLEMKERMKRLGEARHRSTHWMMREAVRQYVEREEKREELRREVVSGWQEYQETGLHVTGAEVLTWLDTWGTDEEETPPICHK